MQAADEGDHLTEEGLGVALRRRLVVQNVVRGEDELVEDGRRRGAGVVRTEAGGRVRRRAVLVRSEKGGDN